MTVITDYPSHSNYLYTLGWTVPRESEEGGVGKDRIEARYG